MADKVRVTLVKSTIGASPAQKKVVEALGLRKIRQSVELPNTPQTRGAVAKVSHLLTMEEI
ncbi:MAG: 50S ribosomal protein L30 [Firmicutes bacterium]|jgi:large subunit ribosomal protein L30|nr:50S ribosomal protein L30 [Bacillota bacterium]MBQ1216077.1 50S ribosomal protein L30 [Bacillota bacterium]MBQ2867270.1 50S ribosomal protein L30 [Bacillota bacterium]MBQ5796462.1 50S ribosomal protein L30 [Bacillota bacterium]MBQ6686100.1 50S ribosomal protein L30 [Bacillota bacterium]